jgi:hydrogenase nickel insertion protein HypA
MHELSLIENMLDQLSIMKRKHGLKEITDVHLSVGAIAGVDVGFLRSYFEMFVPSTPWRDLKMHLTEVPWVVRCKDCSLEQEVDEFNNQCKCCGSTDTETVQGKEFLILRVEGETNV